MYYHSSKKMTVLFRAKTTEGYVIKVLSELLQNTIKTVCLEIGNTGICNRMMDAQRRILMYIELLAHNFTVYEKKNEETMCIGINLNHLYCMLRSMKKKDAIMLHIEEKIPDQLFVTVFPKDNNCIAKSSIH